MKARAGMWNWLDPGEWQPSECVSQKACQRTNFTLKQGEQIERVVCILRGPTTPQCFALETYHQYVIYTPQNLRPIASLPIGRKRHISFAVGQDEKLRSLIDSHNLQTDKIRLQRRGEKRQLRCCEQVGLIFGH